MAIWEMGVCVETAKDKRMAAAASLARSREIVERRGDMAAQCECLAAWDDDRECICDKVVDLPLSLDALSRAEKAAGKLRGVDARLARLENMPGSDLGCQAMPSGKIIGTMGNEYHNTYHFEDGTSCNSREIVGFKIPKSIVRAALREERAGYLRELQETGVISVDHPNIRAVPS